MTSQRQWPLYSHQLLITRSTTHRIMLVEMLIPKAFSSRATIQPVTCFITPSRNQTLIKITVIHSKMKIHNLFNLRGLIKFSLDLVKIIKVGQILYRGQASVLRCILNLRSIKNFQCPRPLKQWPLHSRYRSLKKLSNLWLLVHFSSSLQHWSKPRDPNHIIFIRLEKCLSLLRKRLAKDWQLMESNESLQLHFVPEIQLFLAIIRKTAAVRKIWKMSYSKSTILIWMQSQEVTLTNKFHIQNSNML